MLSENGYCQSRRRLRTFGGELLAHSEKHVDDTGLAATAKVHGLVLLTRNMKHVAGRGVTALDPFKSKPKIAKQ